jgi:heme exporter protein C
LKIVFWILFALAAVAVTAAGFLIPPVPGFQEPNLARLFVWHFPCAMATTALLFFSPYFSLHYLATRDRDWDVRALAANELALLFGVLTMATGMLFSRVQWGAWWQWDPRQTSFLLVLLLFGGYFALRSAFVDDVRRAATAAAYSLASVPPMLFLIFVFPRLPAVAAVSFHPTNTIRDGLMSGDYLYTMLGVLAVLLVATAWLYRGRVAAGLEGLRREELDAELDVGGGGAAPTGVVRPVALQSADAED